MRYSGDLSMKKLLNEYIESDKFELGKAGYIKEDGTFIFMEEYHGEEDSLYQFKYPEFSNTHPEEDTCVRIFNEPNEIQYKKLEEIIDLYLDNEEYCKIEIWNKGKYNFYKVFSLREGACEDYQWDENVGNWTGYKLVNIIKNYFHNLNEKLEKTDSGFFITENVYEAKNKILSYKNEGLRIFIDESIPVYFIGTMYDTTHLDMIKESEEYGYDTHYDAYDENQICLLYDPSGGDDSYFADDAVSDNYFTRYCYPDFDIWSELDKDFTKFQLSKILGKIDGIFDYTENLEESNQLNEQLLLELNRGQLINKSKASDNYKDTSKGRNRWERRNKSKIATRVDQYNKIDMNSFFKNDELKVGINVHGETSDYIVAIRYNGVLKEIAEQIKRNNNKLEFKCILIALQRVFNQGNVFVSCSCLHPSTKIKLLDGSEPTVEELKKRFDLGEKLYVYSTDEKGDFKPGEIENVFITKTTSDFIKITLDNNKDILTTPDHQYMLRDGTYKKAEDLCEGDSLMPIYFNSSNGYETLKLNSKKGWKSTYKLVAEEYFSEEIKQKDLEGAKDNMPYNVAIHHKDFNKNNNNPDNLKVMTSKEHWKYHASLGFDSHTEDVKKHIREISSNNAKIRNQNPSPKMLEQRKKFVEAGRKHNYELSEEELTWRRNNMKSVNKIKNDRLHSLSEEDKKEYYSNIFTDELKNRTPERKEEIKNKVNLTKIEKVLRGMITKKYPLTDDGYNLYIKNELKKHYHPGSYLKYFKDINEAVTYFKLNHKVFKIEKITLDPTPVYDITVKDWHNFLVSAGVVLHNCADWKYRQAYHATRGGYNSGNPEIRASDITNPRDSKGAGCKHVNLVLGNIDWIMKIASVINNYIHYMEDHFERKYADLIFPKLYGMPYQKAIQLNLFDTDDNLSDDEDEIKLSNRYGRERTKFRSDRQVNNMRNFNKQNSINDTNKPTLDLNMNKVKDEIKTNIRTNNISQEEQDKKED